MHFSKGDKVMLVANYPSGNKNLSYGDIGVVCEDVEFDNCYLGIPVDWGRNINGHSCGGRCQRGNGWDVVSSDIEPFFPVDVDDGAEIELSGFDDFLFCISE